MAISDKDQELIKVIKDEFLLNKSNGLKLDKTEELFLKNVTLLDVTIAKKTQLDKTNELFLRTFIKDYKYKKKQLASQMRLDELENRQRSNDRKALNNKKYILGGALLKLEKTMNIDNFFILYLAECGFISNSDIEKLGINYMENGVSVLNKDSASRITFDDEKKQLCYKKVDAITLKKVSSEFELNKGDFLFTIHKLMTKQDDDTTT